jgi:hypothetical protein
MSGVSMQQSHGELKRYLAETLGTDPNRYSAETGCERHKRLTAEEVDRIAEHFGMGLSGETKQQTRDAIMIRLGRDHRTGAHTWDASDLVAVIDSLDQSLQAEINQSEEAGDD